METGEIVTRGGLPHWYMPGMAHFVTYRLADTIPLRVIRQWRARRDGLVQRGPPLGTSAGAYHTKLHKQFFARYDQYLHEHTQHGWLADPQVASIIRDNLHHHNGTKYELLAYTVMPNHVHVLLQPFEITPVGQAASLPPSVGQAASLPPVGRVPAGAKGRGRRSEAGSFGYGSGDCFSDEIVDSRSPLTVVMHSLKSYTANEANAILRRSGRFWQHESYDHWVRDLDELERIVEYIGWNAVKAGLCQAPREWPFSSAFERFQRDGSDCGLIGWLREDWKR